MPGWPGAHPLTMGAQVSPFRSCASKFFQILRSTALGLYSCRSYTCSIASATSLKALMVHIRIPLSAYKYLRTDMREGEFWHKLRPKRCKTLRRTCACPRVWYSTSVSSGPAWPPDFELMKTMRGASGSSGARNFFVLPRYGSGILHAR